MGWDALVSLMNCQVFGTYMNYAKVEINLISPKQMWRNPFICGEITEVFTKFMIRQLKHYFAEYKDL